LTDYLPVISPEGVFTGKNVEANWDIADLRQQQRDLFNSQPAKGIRTPKEFEDTQLLIKKMDNITTRIASERVESEKKSQKYFGGSSFVVHSRNLEFLRTKIAKIEADILKQAAIRSTAPKRVPDPGCKGYDKLMTRGDEIKVEISSTKKKMALEKSTEKKENIKKKLGFTQKRGESDFEIDNKG